MPSPTINAARLNRALEELGCIGETPQGMQRLRMSRFQEGNLNLPSYGFRVLV